MADCVDDCVTEITEAELVKSIEHLRDELVDALDSLNFRLPQKPEQCTLMAEMLAARSCPSPDAPPLLTKEAVLVGMFAVEAVLLDLRAALTGVSDVELQEFVGLGLPLARHFAASFQDCSRKLQDRVDPPCSGTAVLIEEVDTNGECEASRSLPPSHRALRTLPGRPLRVMVCRQNRYVWKPLWPRLMQVYPSIRRWVVAPTMPEPIRKRPVKAATLAVTCGPAALCAAMAASVAVLPSVLLADVAFQRAVNFCGRREVDDLVDGVVQCTRLSFLTSRILLRQGVKVARTQTRRWLGGRTPAEATGDLVKEVWRDPLGSARASAANAWWASSKVAIGVCILKEVVAGEISTRWS